VRQHSSPRGGNSNKGRRGSKQRRLRGARRGRPKQKEHGPQEPFRLRSVAEYAVTQPVMRGRKCGHPPQHLFTTPCRLHLIRLRLLPLLHTDMQHIQHRTTAINRLVCAPPASSTSTATPLLRVPNISTRGTPARGRSCGR